MSTNEDVINHIKQGEIYKKENNLNSAISEYQKALKIEPENTEVLLKLGQIYEIKGDREKETAFYILAQNTYQKVLTKEPNNPEAHNSIISLGIKQSRIDELVKQYKEKLKKDPDNQILLDSVKRLTTISLVSIPPNVKGGSEKKGCAKIFLDYIFPFVGIIPLLLGTMIPKLKMLQSLGILILIIYLIYKFLTAKKPSKSKQW
ncbi:MAG: tetratricopeptide repeat protein [Elusimicrobia bacterium]|nr:tetratricopeptide repeat protein [Elusimicrobiota bacterium]